MDCPICGEALRPHSEHFTTTKKPLGSYYCHVCRLSFDMDGEVLRVVPKYPKTRLEDFAIQSG